MEPFLTFCTDGEKHRFSAVSLGVMSALVLEGDDLDDWESYPEVNAAWFAAKDDYRPRYVHLAGPLAFAIADGPVVAADDSLGFAVRFGFTKPSVSGAPTYPYMSLEALGQGDGERVYALNTGVTGWHYLDEPHQDAPSSEQLLIARPSFFGVFSPTPLGRRSRLSPLALRAERCGA